MPKNHFTRIAWNCNPADPTAVTQWEGRWWRFRLELTAVWDVELNLYYRGRWILRLYDYRIAEWLFDKLEGHWAKQQMEEYEEGEGYGRYYG